MAAIQYRIKGHARFWFAAVLWICLWAPGGRGADDPVVTRVLEVRKLTPEQAKTSVSVQLHAIVTYNDPGAGLLFAQDATAGIFINTAQDRREFPVGSRVRIEGVTEAGSHLPFVNRATIALLGRGDPPPPRVVTAERIADGTEDGNWVEITGVVRQTDPEIEVVSDGWRVKVWIPSGESKEPASRWRIGARLRLRGVGGLENQGGKVLGPVLFAPNSEQIAVVVPGPDNPFSLRPMPVSELTGNAALAGALTHVVGTVSGLTANGLIVMEDGTGSLRVRTNPLPPARIGDWVETVGFADLSTSIPLIEDARVQLRAPRRGAATNEPASRPDQYLPLLTSIPQIRELPLPEVEKGYPVRMRATVTFHDPGWGLLFVQTLQMGIRVETRAALPALPLGRQVEIEGWSGRDRRVPKVVDARVEVLGEGPSPILPQVSSFEAIANGREEGRYIQIRGVTQSATISGGRLFLEFASQSGLLRVVVPGYESPTPLAGLVDAEATIQGVCSNTRGDDTGWRGPRIYLSRPDQLRVTAPPPDNPYTLPPQTVMALRGLPSAEMPEHRVRLRVVVTHAAAVGAIYAQDDTGPVRIHPESAGPAVSIGDLLDVAGFVRGGKLPRLERAVYRIAGQTSAPAPRDISVERAVMEIPEGTLISVAGILLDAREQDRQQRLELKQDGYLFRAEFNGERTRISDGALTPGGLLRVAGVSSLEYDASGAPRYLTVLLRSSSDLKVLKRSPWYASRYVTAAASTMAVGALAAAFWVLSLRRQVRRQTGLIRARFEHEAELEAQLRQAQKMEIIGRLAGGVAHDFNNLLTVIQGNCGLLEMSGELSDEADDALNEIVTATDRAAGLTRQLLTFSRKQIPQPRHLNLNLLIGDMTKMLTRLLGEDVKVEYRCGPTPLFVFADPTMMEQLVMNLSINARDAMPGGGRLSIETAAAVLPSENLPPHPKARPGRFVCLTVSDTGCGMDAATLSRIFEPFFTTKEAGRGTGLGLATVRQVVELHQGWIGVESQPGRGTIFKAYIPEAPKPSVESDTTAPRVSIPGGHETILVVEDEPALRRLASGVLSRAGYRVLEARTGMEALQLWQRQRESIHLVLTDMVLPDGLSGLDLVEKLRVIAPEVKIVFSSGYSQELMAEKIELIEGFNFLPKPYDSACLTRTIRARLDGRSGSSL